MHWVYVLQCENNHIYVGETTRLFRRWNEHLDGCASDNTSSWEPEKILALYRVGNNQSYFDYKYFAEEILEFKKHYLQTWGDDERIMEKTQFENYITEWLKNNYTSVNHWHIAGGKHCRFGWRNKPTIQEPGYNRPACQCGLPAEVNYSEKNDYVYFSCPRSNKQNLLDKFGGLDYDEPCTFWQKYTGDQKARDIWEKERAKWTPPPRPLEQLKQLFNDD